MVTFGTSPTEFDWKKWNAAVAALVDEARRLSPDVLIRFDFPGDGSEGGWGCSLLPNDGTFPNGAHEIYGQGLSPRSALYFTVRQLRDAVDVADWEPWQKAEYIGQRLNEVLHADIGVEPCDTACTHPLLPDSPSFTLLGAAKMLAHSTLDHFTAKAEGKG